MISRYVKYSVAGLFLFLALYLGTVWVWANSAAPDLLAGLPAGHQLTALDSHRIQALLKIEDPSFYAHSGLDLSNGQGLTTMTSVLARMVFFEDRQLDGIRGRLQVFYRWIFNCCKRIDLGRDVMALALDRHVTKQEQLHLFINNAYLGSLNGKSIVGFDKAALAYYGRDFTQLTNDQFYGLISMLIAPNHYHPISNPQAHAQRTKRVRAVILGQCAPDGWLDLTYEHCEADD